jgi:hypothetical protein
MRSRRDKGARPGGSEAARPHTLRRAADRAESRKALLWGPMRGVFVERSVTREGGR